MQKLMVRKVHPHSFSALISSLAQKVDRECSLGEHSARLTVRSGVVMNKTPFLPLRICSSWEMQTVQHVGLYEKEIHLAQF